MKTPEKRAGANTGCRGETRKHRASFAVRGCGACTACVQCFLAMARPANGAKSAALCARSLTPIVKREHRIRCDAQSSRHAVEAHHTRKKSGEHGLQWKCAANHHTNARFATTIVHASLANIQGSDAALKQAADVNQLYTQLPSCSCRYTPQSTTSTEQ